VARWFVIDKGVKAGPFSDDEFFAYLKDKDPARVRIWRQGMSAWVPASDIPQLVGLMAARRRPGRRGRSNVVVRHWRALARGIATVSVIALAGVGAIVGVPHLYMTYRSAPPDPLPQEKAPAAPVEPERPAPPAPSRISREDFADAVRGSMSLLDSLQQRFPKQYDELVGEFYEKISNGEPEAETAAAMRRKAFSMIKALLPLADDDVLIALNKVVEEKYRALNRQNPSYCYSFGAGADSAELSAVFPDELQRRERDLYEHAIRTAAPRAAPDPRKLAALRDGLRRALLAGGVTESQFNLLDAPNVPPAQHAQYCDVTILLFREIGKLPQEDAATVMRLLMSGK
jgi:hypothetical protein